MNKISKHRFIKALNRQVVDRTPVWIMRQAGRYMPEYRELRTKAGSFLELCKNPELACSATLLPIKRYPLDAAILFSDILLIPEAMGLGLEFIANEGPVFAKSIRNEADVVNLPEIDPDVDLAYVSNAIKLIKNELNNSVPLIGFAGSPWTIAAYMVEGKADKQFYKLKGLMYQQPEVMHMLLDHLSKQILRALQAQIDAGVDVVMLFDSWGGILTDSLFKEFSLAYMVKIVQNIRNTNDVPVIIFSKNGGRCLPDIAASGCAGIGLDWTADLAEAKKMVGTQVALQGNMDPCVLYANDARIVEEVQHVLKNFGSGYGHIFNLGHGIPYDIEPKKVDVMLKAIEEFSSTFNQSLQTV